MKIKYVCLSFLICFVLALAVGSQVMADVILYYDNFDGATGSPLNATTPDTSISAYGATGANWAAGTGFAASGTVTYDNVGFGDTAILPFVPQLGLVYTLSMTSQTYGSTYRGTSAINDWLAMGFIRTADPTKRFYDDPSGNANNPVYWMMARTDLAAAGQFDQSFIGAITSSTGETNGGINSSGFGQDNMKIVLDTTAATWTAKWYYNDVLARTENVAETAKPYFQYIFVSNARSDGNIDQITLSVVPEPATGIMALIGICGLALIWLRKSR